MSDEPKPTKQERRDAARAARRQAEHRDAAAAQRARRLRMLLIVLGGAAVIVAAAIVVSGRGGGGGGAKSRPAAAQKATGAIPGQKESSEMLTGIPQQGRFLGNPNAPVTLVEFADLQCPFCREYTLQTLPRLVQDYVRTGKVRMELRMLWFIGDDSVTAARAAAGATQQNKLWNFADVFYYNQGEENSGYVTPTFLDRIYKASGVAAAKAGEYAASDASKEPLGAANTLANRYGVQSTPTILVGKRGGQLKAVDVSSVTDFGSFKSAIDGVLGQA
jgi:protein-disulfide isomerase